jgi:hypothetical protein
MRKALFASMILTAGLILPALAGEGPSVKITTEYIGTLEIELDPAAQAVGPRVVIWDKDATFVGPKIRATQLQPAGDWLIPQPDGSLKLDIRATFKTDDGELLLWEANGVAMAGSKEQADRFAKGEQLGPNDYYLFETPRISTTSKKYEWLSQLQLVGKMTTLKNSHVGFDIFAVH